MNKVKMNVHSEVLTNLDVNGNTYHYYSLEKLENQGTGEISSLPFSIKALLESALRQFDGKYITADHISLLANWHTAQKNNKEVPFKPARIILQDFTGVPAMVDLAAMRNAVANSEQINPRIPVDLVVDHSVIVDASGTGKHLITI